MSINAQVLGLEDFPGTERVTVQRAPPPLCIVSGMSRVVLRVPVSSRVIILDLRAAVTSPLPLILDVPLYCGHRVQHYYPHPPIIGNYAIGITVYDLCVGVRGDGRPPCAQHAWCLFYGLVHNASSSPLWLLIVMTSPPFLRFLSGGRRTRNYFSICRKLRLDV